MEKEKEAEIRRLEHTFSIERKDIESAYRMQVTELEEHQDKEIRELRERFEREKEQLMNDLNRIKDDYREELQRGFDEKMAEVQRKLQADFADEKQDLMIKFESEKNHLQQKYLDEKHKLEDKLREEFDREMKRRLKEQKEEFERELDEMEDAATRSREDAVQEREEKIGLQWELNKQKEMFEREKIEMMNEFAKEKRKTAEEYQREISELENSLSKRGREGLRGRLQADFYALLEKEKEQVIIEEKANVSEKVKKAMGEETRKMNKDFEKEKEKLEMQQKMELEVIKVNHEQRLKESMHRHEKDGERLRKEKSELENKVRDLQSLVNDLNKQAQNDQSKVKDLNELVDDLNREAKNVEEIREHREEELAQEFQQKFEEEFVEQIEKLKGAFDEERMQMKLSERLLQQEIEDLKINPNARATPEMEVRLRVADNEIKELEFKKNLLEEELKAVNRRHEECIREADVKVKNLQKELKEAKKDVKRAKKVEPEIERVYSERVESLSTQVREQENRASEASVSLRLAQAEHIRECEDLREKIRDMVDKDEHELLNNKLDATENKCKALQLSLQQREQETTRMIVNAHEEHKRKLNEMIEEKDTVEKRLMNTQDLLKQQTAKLLEQLNRNSKSDLLIKDLYIENSQLVKTLYDTERRAKEANSKLYSLEEKNSSLQQVLAKVSVAALA